MKIVAKRAFALPMVLVAIIVFAIIGVSAMGLFLNRGERLKTTYAQKQAQLAAEGGFNLAIGKLLQAPLKNRWFASDTSAHLVSELSGSLLDVFLCDVYNGSGQLTHIHVVTRCQRALDAGFQQVSTIVFGTVQVSGEDGDLTATVLSRQKLEPSLVEAFVKANESLFSADNNPYAKSRRVSLSETTYVNRMSSIRAELAAGDISEIDFSDGQNMRSFVAMLERYLELKRELRLARLANEMLRDSSIAEVLRLASDTDISLAELLSTLRAIQGQGPALTSDRASELSGQLSRSQRELLIIYLLLKRLAALPSDSSVTLDGKKLSPPEAAKRLAKLLYKKIMGNETTETDLAKIFDKLLGKGEKLNGRNVFRTFFKVVKTVGLQNGLVPEMKLPLRTQCIELARMFEPDSSRIAYNSTGIDVWQVGGTAFTEEQSSQSSNSDDDDDDDDDDERNSGAAYGSISNQGTGPISKHGFERSLSALGLYEENSSAHANVRANIENYIQSLVENNGIEGYQEAALQAGLLGMDEEQAELFGDILQDLVTDAGIRWLTLNIPSPLTEATPGPIALDVPLSETTAINSLPAVEEEANFSSPGSAGSANEPANAVPSNANNSSSSSNLENNYDSGGGGGSELWVSVGTAVNEPIVGPTPPPPPPPPAPPPSTSSSGGGGGGGSQPSGGGSNSGGTEEPGEVITEPPVTTTPTGGWWNNGGGDDDDDDDDNDDSG